ncbi:hypothetical protein D3C80_1436460 [compost metagenome]
MCAAHFQVYCILQERIVICYIIDAGTAGTQIQVDAVRRDATADLILYGIAVPVDVVIVDDAIQYIQCGVCFHTVSIGVSIFLCPYVQCIGTDSRIYR